MEIYSHKPISSVNVISLSFRTLNFVSTAGGKVKFVRMISKNSSSLFSEKV